MVYNFGVSKAVATVKYLYDRYIGKITTYTVASQEETDKSSLDFTTLEEALTFAENCSIVGGGTVNLHLQDGTHYLERDSHQPSVAGNGVAAYNFNHTHIFLSCDSKWSAVVTFSPDVKINGGYVFRTGNSKLGFTYVKVDFALGGAEQIKNPHFIRSNNSYIFLNRNSVKGLNKDDFAYLIYAEGNTFVSLANNTIDTFYAGVIAVRGVVSGILYRTKFKNTKYTTAGFGYSFGNISVYGLIYENVDNLPIMNSMGAINNENFFIATFEGIAIKDNRRLIKNSSERPEMDGVPDPLPYRQEDLGRIYYEGKDDDGNDIWIDSNGNEV